MQQYNDDHSHWNSNSSLSNWLKLQGVPALHGIDTRMLTKRIRDGGAVLAKIEFDGARCVFAGCSEKALPYTRGPGACA